MFEAWLVLIGGSVDLEPLIGAFDALESSKVNVSRIVATSTASIFAALRSTGYILSQIRHGWTEFIDASRGRVLDKDNLGPWLAGLLQQQGVRTFADLKRLHGTFHRPELKIIIKDMESQKLLTLPDDALEIGVGPDDLEVVAAVRASLSIPGISPPERIGQRDLGSIFGPVRGQARSVDYTAWRPAGQRRSASIYLYLNPGTGLGMRDRIGALVLPKYRRIRATELAIANALKQTDPDTPCFEGEGNLKEAAGERYIVLQALAGVSSRQSVLENARETRRRIGDLVQYYGISLPMSLTQAPAPSEAVETPDSFERDRVEAYVNEGWRSFESGNLARAKESLQKALEADARHELARNLLEKVEEQISASARGEPARPFGESKPTSPSSGLHANHWIEDQHSTVHSMEDRLKPGARYRYGFSIARELRLGASTEPFKETEELKKTESSEVFLEVNCDLIENFSVRRRATYWRGHGLPPEYFDLQTRAGDFDLTISLVYFNRCIYRRVWPLTIGQVETPALKVDVAFPRAPEAFRGEPA